MKKKKKNSKQFNKKFKKQFLTRKSLIVIGCTAVILLAVALGCLHLERVERKTQERIDALNTEIKDIEDTNESLAREKDNLDSEESRKRLAKERLGMIEEDEYLLQESGEETDSSAKSDKAEDKKESSSQDSGEEAEEGN
ncbi:MAG: septum formation initiator family protein [Eubacterium sp.]|nr:septum formation initiator family protein [Eubacterium sp.]